MEMCSTMTTIPDALLQFRDVRFDGESSHVHDIFAQLKKPTSDPSSNARHASPSTALARLRSSALARSIATDASPSLAASNDRSNAAPYASRSESYPAPAGNAASAAGPLCNLAHDAGGGSIVAPSPSSASSASSRSRCDAYRRRRSANRPRPTRGGVPGAPDSSNPPLDPSRKPSPSPWKSWKSLSPPLPRQPSPPVSSAAPSERLRSRCSASAARASSSDAASVSAARLAPSSAASRLAALAAYARAPAPVSDADARSRASLRCPAISRALPRALSRTYSSREAAPSSTPGPPRARFYLPIDDPRNRLASRRWTWRARRARRDVRASVPLVGFCVWPQVASRRTSSVGFGIPSSRERSSRSSRRRRRRVRRRRFPPSGTGTVPIGKRRRDGRVPSGSPRRGWKAGASPGNRARVAGRVVAAKATATATANGTDFDGLRTSTDGTPPRGVPVPRAGTGTGMDLRPRRTPPQTRRRRIRRFGRRGRGRGGPAGRVPRSRRARARRRTRAGLVAAPRRGRRCGAGGRRARAGAGAGGGRHREGLVGGIVAEVVVVHLLGDLGALGRRRHRVGTRCNHTPRRRTRGGGDGRARGGRSRRRARNPRCSRYARNRGSARARRGVRRPRGRRVSERVSNVVVLTGERANGRYYFFIVLPPARPRGRESHACTQVRLAVSPSLSPWDRHATTSSYKSRPSGAPRYAIRNDARLAYTTANPGAVPPRQISTPPASPPPRRRGRRPSSDSPRPT